MMTLITVLTIIAILLLLGAVFFIRQADNSDARATSMITLLPGLTVAGLALVLFAGWVIWSVL